MHGTVSTLTFETLEETDLLVVTRDLYLTCINKVQQRDLERKIDFLRGLPCFKHFRYSSVVKLLDVIQERRMMKGSYLINEGDPVEGLSIVRDGLFDIKVRISNELAHFKRDNALPQVITLSTIGPGEVISYDELVTGQEASSVTVKSKSNAEVWFIPKHRMGSLASRFQDEESL